MATYRIDDLARAAGTTVRHVRAFQEKGLLPPPEMRGRVGFYDDSHLARIRVIGELKERGFTLASIAEMIRAWERGHNLSDVLGLEKVLTDHWSGEVPEYLTLAEVVRRFYPNVPDEALEGRSPEDFPSLARAEELEFIVWTGDRYEIPSPRLLRVGAELVAAGVRLSAVFDIAGKLREDCDAIARRFVRLTVEQAELDDSLRNAVRGDLVEIGELIQRLRPLGLLAVEGLLARSLHAEIQGAFSDQIQRMVEQRPGTRTGAATGPGAS